MVVVALEEKPRQIGNGNKSIVAIFAGKDTINHNPHPLKPPPLPQEMMSNSEVSASANNTSKDEDNHMLNFEDTDRDLGPTTPGQC